MSNVATTHTTTDEPLDCSTIPDWYADCTCSRYLGRVQAVNHDWLLGLEARGIAGAAELFAYVEACIEDPESTRREESVDWLELTNFVARHNWRDPAAMMEVAGWAETFGRPRSAALDATTMGR
ncbi:MAG: hypothetical protein AB7L17_04445 [Ilumatobacteraceae bacterium]